MILIPDADKIEALRVAAGYPSHDAIAKAMGVARPNYTRIVRSPNPGTKLEVLSRLATVLRLGADNWHQLVKVKVGAEPPPTMGHRRDLASRRRKYAERKSLQGQG